MEVATRSDSVCRLHRESERGLDEADSEESDGPRDGFLLGARYLLMDRDSKFCQAFRNILKQSDIEPVKLPPRSPNLTPHIERFMRSIKEECLKKMIFFGERSLRNGIKEFCRLFLRETAASTTNTTKATAAMIHTAMSRPAVWSPRRISLRVRTSLHFRPRW